MVVAKRVLVVLAIVLFSGLVWFGERGFVDRPIPLNRARAISRIRDLNEAQQKYAARHPEIGFACDLSSLGQHSELGPDAIDPVLASGTKSGYHFELRCSHDTTGKATNYEITALPLIPGTTGRNAICTDQSSKIWDSKNGSAQECLTRQKQFQLERLTSQ
jgi:hypothetical protein